MSKDGLLEPTSELRKQIAEVYAEGKRDGITIKEVAEKVDANYDYVRKALKDEDVRAHVIRVTMDDEVVMGKMTVKDWVELAPRVQLFYEHIMKRAMEEPDWIDVKVGYDAQKDEDITERRPNPLAQHYQRLARDIAARIEDRAWGKTPQRIDHELTPGGDRIENLKDHQLAAYRRMILRGLSPTLALEEAKRTKALPPGEQEQFEDFMRDQEEAIQEAEFEVVD